MPRRGCYPEWWSAPNKGVCEVCGVETMAWDKRWVVLCPEHWQELERRKR